jgi:hypothetical protein
LLLSHAFFHAKPDVIKPRLSISLSHCHPQNISVALPVPTCLPTKELAASRRTDARRDAAGQQGLKWNSIKWATVDKSEGLYDCVSQFSLLFGQ